MTTREPYCKLGIFAYWGTDQIKLKNHTGIGRAFFNKIFVSVDRESGNYAIGFRRGVNYRSWSLILPTVLYYLSVISILITLAIWLSIKKYRRLEEEKRRSPSLLQSTEKVEDLKDVSKALRKMDFNMNMSGYNKVFERQSQSVVN